MMATYLVLSLLILGGVIGRFMFISGLEKLTGIGNEINIIPLSYRDFYRAFDSGKDSWMDYARAPLKNIYDNEGDKFLLEVLSDDKYMKAHRYIQHIIAGTW